MKKYHSLQSTRYNVEIEYPNVCPKCNMNISPVYENDYMNNDDKKISVLFSCPACRSGFLSYYDMTNNRVTYSSDYYYQLNFVDSFPKEFKAREFSEHIISLSPLFCEIYNQSLQAETENLNQIAGMGYRKAIEFLIKDYCLSNNDDAEEQEKIKKMSLAQVINTYVTSDRLEKLAKASAWIGNDETHYVRKYEDKDISHLKNFINATILYIEYEMTAIDAEEFINQ